jgi:hypothetical protein
VEGVKNNTLPFFPVCNYRTEIARDFQSHINIRMKREKAVKLRDEKK